MMKKQPKSLTTTIDSLETSLGGQSNGHSITIWSQENPTESSAQLSLDLGDWDETDFQATATVGRTIAFESLAEIRMGTGTHFVRVKDQGDDAISRWLGHVLVSAMPTSGISDAITELAEIYKFCQEQDSRMFSRTEIGTVPRRVSTKVKPIERSTPFTFDE